MRIFHELDERFDGKLRKYSIEKRLARMEGEEIVFSEGIAYIDAIFDLEIFDHLHRPNIIGIERVTDGDNKIFLLFEVLGAKPMHYEMPSLTPEVPPILKWEYLNTIRDSWVEGGENWMEIIAIHSGYLMKVDGERILFEKTTLSPLVGSRAHIMSRDIVRRMVCIDGDKADDIGILIGYDIPLKIDIYSLFKYHTGIFGFTGTGKSNLTSLLIRKIYRKIPELKILIFDLSGEYTVHLLDLLSNNRYPVYTDELISRERFSEIQVIPESIIEYGESNNIDMEELIQHIVSRNIELIHLNLNPTGLTVERLLDYINKTIKEEAVHLSVYAEKLRGALGRYPKHYNIFKVFDEEPSIKDSILEYMNIVLNSYSERSNAYKATKQLIGLIESPEIFMEGSTDEGENIYDLATSLTLDPNHPRISILYIPDPRRARMASSILINEIFKLKKTHGLGNKILIVLDEAQEFIPDRQKSEDYTLQSNQAVEMLLRQGRKFLIGCWIATQRIAHLNTNALQQLHSYFVSTLPRSYDRNVVSDAFSISRSIIDKVNELDVGEWLFVSYKATNLKNVPVEIKAYNNENILIRGILKIRERARMG